MSAEFTFNWGELLKGVHNFNSDLEKIAAIEKVTKADLVAFAHEVFYNNPRRLNVKVHSHSHLSDAAAIEASRALNKIYYEREDLFGSGGLKHLKIENIKVFQKAHDLHPRL